MIRKAMEIARKAHAGQVDKGGKPYIQHPIAVAEMVSTEDEKVVALLHDVVEDTDITLDALSDEGFPIHIIKAIGAITRQKGENLISYISRVKKDPIAREVKKADLKHNMDLTRIPNITDTDINRTKLYEWQYRYLCTDDDKLLHC